MFIYKVTHSIHRTSLPCDLYRNILRGDYYHKNQQLEQFWLDDLPDNFKFPLKSNQTIVLIVMHVRVRYLEHRGMNALLLH